MSVHALHIPELDELIQRGSPERRAKTLERMIAFFLDGASRFNDHHVRLFDLVFIRLIGDIETKARTELSYRLAPLGNAPVDAVRCLAQDDAIAVAGPVLKRAERLSDADLIDIAQNKSQAHLLAISARVRIAEPVTDVLLRRGEREVLHSVADNRGARLSDHGFCTLVERAKTDGALAEKVVLRPDIPPRLFHDLLLTATHAVQRRLIAVAASETQSEIHHMSAKVSNEADALAAPRDHSRAQRRIEALRQDGKLDETVLVDFAQKGQYGETIAALASLCAVPIEVVDRLMGAERSDPVLILCKAAGWRWSTTEAIIAVRPGSARTSSPDFDAARADFDRLSPATAQRVMRFWQVRSDDGGRTTDDGRG
jgi:uncharacterized protein (DUF2336 family)